jgi:MFS family permease
VIAPDVRGPGAIAALCLRCVAVLTLVNAIAPLIALLVWGREASGSGLMLYLVYSPYVLLVALFPIGLAGFPAGVLTAHLLARERREWVHVLVFALVGGVLSVTICAFWGSYATSGWWVLVAFAEGVVGAGGARWWTGRARARRARWSDQESAALPWGRIGP